MRRTRTKTSVPSFTSRPWRIEFEQSPLADAWVYKFQLADTDGSWTELPGKVRSAYRVIAGVVQLISEVHGLSGKMWRALLAQLQHVHPIPIDDVFEGRIFSTDGRLFIRSIWITDADAVRLTSLDEASLHAAHREVLAREITRTAPKRTVRS